MEYVPQRSAAKAAQAKMQHTPRRKKILVDTPSVSSAFSLASSSPPSDATGSSSAASASTLKSTPQKLATKTFADRPRTAKTGPSSDSTLSYARTGGIEEEVQGKTVPLASPSVKTPTRNQHRRKRTSPLVDLEPSSPKPAAPALADAPSPPMRSTSKRSAAQAAQNSIQRSYSDFDFEDAPTQKKARASTASRSSTLSRSKPERDNRDTYRAPSSFAIRTQRASAKRRDHATRQTLPR